MSADAPSEHDAAVHDPPPPSQVLWSAYAPTDGQAEHDAEAHVWDSLVKQVLQSEDVPSEQLPACTL